MGTVPLDFLHAKKRSEEKISKKQYFISLAFKIDFLLQAKRNHLKIKQFYKYMQEFFIVSTV